MTTTIPDVLEEAGEQVFLVDLIETLESDYLVDSDDEVLPEKTDVCANCQLSLEAENTSCSHCQVTQYCSLNCRDKDWSFHRFACSVVAQRSAKKLI